VTKALIRLPRALRAEAKLLLALTSIFALHVAGVQGFEAKPLSKLSPTNSAWRDMLDGPGDSAQIRGDRRILEGQLVEIANFDIGWDYTRPLGARPQEPTVTPNHPRGVKCISWNQELDMMPITQVGADDHPLCIAIAVQQEHLKRIAEVIVIELIVANAVKPDRRTGRDHKIQR
jgi:hypothetical protein